jgi:hypothetical protein
MAVIFAIQKGGSRWVRQAGKLTGRCLYADRGGSRRASPADKLGQYIADNYPPLVLPLCRRCRRALQWHEEPLLITNANITHWLLCVLAHTHCASTKVALVRLMMMFPRKLLHQSVMTHGANSCTGFIDSQVHVVWTGVQHFAREFCKG